MKTFFVIGLAMYVAGILGCARALMVERTPEGAVLCIEVEPPPVRDAGTEEADSGARNAPSGRPGYRPVPSGIEY